MPKIWEKVRRGGFLFSLVIGLLTFSLINITDINTADAAVTKQINYQGKLLNSGGTPVSDGSHNIKFSIFDVSSGGTCIWTAQGTCGGTVNPKSVTTKTGIFTTILGESGDNALDLDFSGSSYYLEIEVFNGSTYDVLSPRLQMGAVLNAINANNLIGDGYINITGTPTGIGVEDGTMYINPTSSSSNNTLLGVAVGGSIKARVDAEGDMDLAGALASGGINVDSGVLYTDSLNNVNIYSNYANNWTARLTDSNGYWYDIDMSYDGRVQTATAFEPDGYIFCSYDYGMTWTKKTSPGLADWEAVAVSEDGKFQTAIDNDGYIYSSSDYGVNWTQRTAAGTAAWEGVAMSADGRIQEAVISGGYIWGSTDYGVTWNSQTSAGSRNWENIEVSPTGKYQVAFVNPTGYLYVSSDYGVSWTEKTSLGTKNWRVATLSFDGKYQYVSVDGDYIYASTDYGATWGSKTGSGSRTWRGVSTTSDGKILTAVVLGGYIYNSIDYGTTWYQKTSDTTRNWRDVSISSNGRIQTAIAGTSGSNDYIYTSITPGSIGVNTTTPGQALTINGDLTSALKAGYLSTDNVLLSSLEGGSYFGNTGITENQWENTGFANTWVQKTTDTTRNWYDIAMSSDGRIQTSAVDPGYIYNSTDYGNTWTQNTSAPSGDWHDIAMSADGKIQAAVRDSNYIYGSIDYGITWTQRTTSSIDWYNIAISSDGKYQTAVGWENSYIYASNDYGFTWAAKTSTLTGYHSLAMSSDGKIQTAGVNGGYIWRSIDYGNTWNQSSSISGNWRGLITSVDGKYQTASINGGYIYSSSDYGATWTQRTSGGTRDWDDIAMTSNGKFQVAVANNSYIWASSDYGVTWTQKTYDATPYWTAVAMSSDGKVMTAVAYGGYIYGTVSDSYIFGNIGIGTSTPTFNLTVNGNIGSGLTPVLASLSRTNVNLADSDNVGSFTSMAIGVDGLPIIAHYNVTDGDILVTHCDDIQCTTATTVQFYDSDNMGANRGISLVIGNDGLPIIAYSNATDEDLVVTKCGNTECSANNVNTIVDSANSVGFVPEIAIGQDGLPIIAYYDYTAGYLQTVKCTSSSCSTYGTPQQIVAYGYSSSSGTISIKIGPDGLPVLAYFIPSGPATIKLGIAKCGNSDCSSGNTTTIISNQTYPSHRIGYEQIGLGIDGNNIPIFSYYNIDDYHLWVVKCGNTACSAGNTETQVSYFPSSSDNGVWSSIAFGTDGLPVISHRDYGASYQDLLITKCGNASCSSNSTVQIDTGTTDIGRHTSLAIGANGMPIVSHYDNTNGNLNILSCVNSTCSSTSATVLSGGSKIGGLTIPYDTIYALKFSNPTSYANTAFMQNGVERMTITTAGLVGIGDTTPSSGLSVGITNSDGVSADFLGRVGVGTTNPTFMLTVNGNIGSTTSPTVSTVSRTTTAISDPNSYYIGYMPDIAIGIDGLPVIAHRDASNYDLLVTKCGNKQCTLGNVTSNVATASDGDLLGKHASIAIGSDGLPIISHLRWDTGTSKGISLAVTHCNNISCTSADTYYYTDASTDDIGWFTSLTIGSDGLPIIAYVNNTDTKIEAVKCNTVSCSDISSRTATVPSTVTSAEVPSIAIGTDGYPIISFVRDAVTQNLIIVKCGDLTCTSGNATKNEITGPGGDAVGYMSSIAIGFDGFPVISYENQTDTDLMIVHCTDANCSTYDTPAQITETHAISNADESNTSIAIGTDGLPIVTYAHYDSSLTYKYDLMVTHCSDKACSSNTTTQLNPSTYDEGQFNAIAIGADGLPIISYYYESADDLYVTACADATCSLAGPLSVLSGGSTIGSSAVPYQTINALQFSNPTAFSNFSFLTNGTEKMTITQAGLVGVGTTAPTSGLSVGITKSDGVSADFLGSVGIGTSTPAFKLQVNGNIGASSAPTLSTISRTNADIEPDYSGYFHSITIGTDGLPIIAYFNSGDYALMVTKCGNTQCSSGNITTTIVDADVDEIGWNPSIAIGSDGLPVISHHNETDGDLIITKCGDIACSSGNTTTQIHDSNNYDIGDYSDIVIGSDGFPIVEYYDNTNYVLMVSKCNNHDCTSRAATSVFSSPGSLGKDGSITIGTDGLPIISTTRDISPGTLAVVKCGDLACTTGSATITQITDSGSDWWGYQTSIAIGKDGLPVISHYNGTDLDLTITKCSNIACTRYASNQIADSGSNDIGMGTSLAIGTDGLPIISYFNDTDDDIMITKCGDIACTPTGATTTQINYGNNEGDNGGTDSSIMIGSDGLPIVGYLTTDYSTIYNLVTTACADPTCSLTSSAALSNGSFIGSSSNPYQSVNALQFSNPTAFSNLTFSTNSVSRLTITSEGLIGMGTSTPTEALQVMGNVAISRSTSASSESWDATSSTSAPADRYGQATVWTGSKMIVWGGYTGSSRLNTGAIFDPTTNTWTATSTGTNCPSARTYPSAVWTGSKMIVWGGNDGTYLNTGAIFDPATNTWSTMASTSIAGRIDHNAIWTGSKMIVWGGETASTPTYANDGGVYDPISNTWVTTSSTSPPSAKTLSTATWTGSKMIIIGGRTTGTYASTEVHSFDPTTNSGAGTWTSLTAIPAGRSYHSAVWTGSKIIVWGGRSASSTYLDSGYIYDVERNSWSAAIATSPSTRYHQRAVWTGSKMMIWGGINSARLYDGSIYDPVVNAWTTMATSNLTTGRTFPSCVWTGSKMIIWGGYSGSGALGDGGIYTPPSHFGGNLFVEGDGLINGELHTVGPITSGGFYSLSGADLAETYLSRDNLEPGTLITPDILNSEAITISSGIPYDNKVIGVVSTLPGMTLGYGSSPTSEYPYSLPIALSGRVPVRVSSENGPINVGDPITSSSIPGVAMKATNEGNILGTALESFDPTTKGEQCSSNPEYTCSKILTFISMSYIRPSSDNELRIEDITLNLSKQVEEQEDKIIALESELDGLSTKLTNITFGEDAMNISGEVRVERITINLDMTIFGKLVTNGDLTVSGDSIFSKNVIASKRAEFNNDVVFVENPTLNPNAAGFITLEKGMNTATIQFEHEYVVSPLVFADLSLPASISPEDKNLILTSLTNNTLRYSIINRSTKGFTIELTENAPADIRFSWQAISVGATTTTTATKP